jgi:hypothetical protein
VERGRESLVPRTVMNPTQRVCLWSQLWAAAEAGVLVLARRADRLLEV